MAADLVVFKKNGKRIEIPIKTGVTVVGRRPDCDVRIPVGTVSRKHCRIIKKDEGFVLQDLGSANGTFLNSKRIMEEVINAGDRISVGAFHFTFRIDGKPEHVEPPKAPSPAKKGADSSQGSGFDDTANNASATGTGTFANGEPLADFDNLDDSSTSQRK